VVVGAVATTAIKSSLAAWTDQRVTWDPQENGQTLMIMTMFSELTSLKINSFLTGTGSSSSIAMVDDTRATRMRPSLSMVRNFTLEDMKM